LLLFILRQNTWGISLIIACKIAVQILTFGFKPPDLVYGMNALHHTANHQA
jgi:hypothetical protein